MKSRAILNILYFSILSFSLGHFVEVHSENAPNQLHVGAVLPVSGDYAQYGKELWRGIEIANKELSEKGHSIKITLEDGATMIAQSGLAAATKLVKVDGVQLIVVLGADDIGPLIGLAKGSGIPLVSLWDNSIELRRMSDFVFSSGFSVEATGSHIARFIAQNLHLKRVAIISNNTIWSSGITAAFRREFVDNDGEVVFDEAVEDSWTDFRSLVSRISRQKPTVVYLPLSLPGSVEACIKQLRQNGVSVPIFTGEAFVGDTMKRLGKLAEGIYVAWLPNPDPTLRKRYQSQYGEQPWDERVIQVGFTGMVEIAAAAESRKTETLKGALLKHFGPTRSLSQELALYRVTEAKLVPVEGN